MKRYYKLLFWASIFCVSMAYIESAVVVYLREIYYPNGFKFPLKQITPFIYFIEIGRELATIVMLYVVSKLICKNKMELFAFFSFNFSVWDIWYYIWLKIFLDWPESFLTWDVLFLIPFPWIAPVLAPILVSLFLIIAAIIILKMDNQFKFNLSDWLIEIFAGIIIIASFLFQLEIIELNKTPTYFPWWLFGTGLSAGFIWFIYRVNQFKKKN